MPLSSSSLLPSWSFESSTISVKYCEETIRNIPHNERVIKLIADNPGHKKDDYIDPILECIRDRQLDKPLPKPLPKRYKRNPETGGLETFVLPISKSDATKNKERIPIKDLVLESDVIERSLVINPEICEYITRSSQTSELVRQFKELKTLEVEIQNYLRRILSRREYVKYTCSLCPGEQSSLSELKSKYKNAFSLGIAWA